MTKKHTLGIDIGNTSIKTALFSDEGVSEVSRWDDIKQVLDAHPETNFVVSSVGKGEKFPAFWLNTSTPIPLALDYDTPDTLGMDRLAAAVGAWSLFPDQNILVIDAGTCVTYDLVTSDGSYRGGVISPGLEMRLKAMHHFTAGLPDLSVESVGEIEVGKSTKDCMQLGASVGLKNEIEGFLQTFNKKHTDLQVVTTGGLLPSFDSDIKKPIFASSKIVLIGLHAIWKFNEGN